jgi:hypothetical protein
MDKSTNDAQNLRRSWELTNLIHRLCHALEIASLTVEHLVPNGYADPKNPSASIRPEKPIAETAVLLHGATLAIAHAEVSERIHRVARQLIPRARNSQIRLGLALNPALAFDYSLAHIVLTRLGYPDADFQNLLIQCRTAQAHAGRERLPHRMMEQDWIDILWKECGAEGHRRLERTARLSILSHPMDLFAATDDDLYAFTHAIMYATGFQQNPSLLPRSRAVLLTEAEAVLARCLDAQDYDLAGEILLAWPLTGKHWSPTATFAFHVLAEVEDKAGFLPTPATRVSELQTRNGADRTNYLLATAYHTAYVMGLLCAAALQPGCAPPISISTKQGTPGSARQLLALLDDSSSTPHWRNTFDKLDSSQADALASLLFNIALQRSASRRDFATLDKTLRLGHALGLATTPAASQANELLGRVACAGTLQVSQIENPISSTIAPSSSPTSARAPIPSTSSPSVSGTEPEFLTA